MLVLTRRLNQAIVIGNDVRIMVVEIDRDHVRLGIEAPRGVPIHRLEVLNRFDGDTLRKAPKE